MAEYCQEEDHEEVEVQRHTDCVDFEASGSRYAGEKFYGGPASAIKRKVPVSVALWGPLFEEGRICRIGMALERALGVQSLRPQLPS